MEGLGAYEDAAFAALLCVISLPHVWYVYLWTRPRSWMQSCKKRRVDPSVSMAQWAMAIKALQFGSYAAWVLLSVPGAPLIRMDLLSDPVGWAAAAAFVVGQTLNGAAYRRLGLDGIYYGARFNKSIPWCSKWPYGGPLAVPHPQYVGSVISMLGAIVLTSSPEHYASGHAATVGAWWSTCYLLSGLTEAYL